MVEFRVLAVVGLLLVAIVSVVASMAGFAVAVRLRPVWERMREDRVRNHEVIGRQRC
jgi:hypothetical protein